MVPLSSALIAIALLAFSPRVSDARATITVTSTADSGAGSLRQAIASAAPGDTIIFSLAAGSSIGLTTGTLSLDKNLTIRASAPSEELELTFGVPAGPQNLTSRIDGPAGITFYVRVRALGVGGAGPASNEIVVRR